MRIGHIIFPGINNPGGTENYIFTFLSIFNKKKFTQTIYQAQQNDNDRIKVIPTFRLFFIKRKPVYTFSFFLNTRFLDFLKEDLLITHDYVYYLPLVWFKKTIVVSHGVRWERPQKEQSWYNFVHWWSAKFAFKFAYSLVANDSDFFRKLGINLKPKERMFQEIIKNRWFIPNCVDTNKFKKSQSIKSLQSLNPILVPRNIVRGRGIHLAILAFKEFSKKFKNTSLVICGDFSDVEYKYEIFNLIKDLDLIGKVYFIGSIDWNLMPRIYSSSFMTVIPTLYEEGTSLAALESMSCGTPVVSTTIGGLLDLPTLHASPETKDLAEKMIFCFKKRNNFSKQQQSEVRKIYNLENFEKAWLSVLKD